MTPALRPGTEFRAQDPKAKAPPVDLDAEREKLRMKDVEAWRKLPIKSMDQVVDVKKTTQPLEMPPSITDEEKAKMPELLQKAKEGSGARADRALRELEKMGYPAMLFLINQLRDIDYKDTAAALWGMRLNTILQNITMGVNTGYVAVDIGETMDPRKAQWNAMTVQQWLGGVKSQWPTREKFDEYIKTRKARREAELDGGDPKKDDPKKGDPKKDEPKKGDKV